jgi:parallel beta-helix repeat protein
MTEDRSRALVPQAPGSLSVVSRLAERTLAERSARSDALAVAGRTLVVGPGGYATIAEAVALALDGDTILVRPGTYHESVTVTRSITVIGDGKRGDIVIEFDGAPCLVLQGSAARIASLTIHGTGQHSHLPAAAILVNGGSPILDQLAFSPGWGIVVEGLASPTIRSCEMHGSLRNAILVVNGAAVTIEDNDIMANPRGLIGEGGTGILVRNPEAEPHIRSNRIWGWRRGGVVVMAGADGVVEGNDVFLGRGTGIVVTSPGTALLIRGNRIHAVSDGVYVGDGARAVIENNQIFRNHRFGLFVTGTGTAPVIRANQIHDNDGIGILATGEWPHIQQAGVEWSIEANDIFGNGAGIDIAGANPAPLIRANQIYNCRDSGIRFGLNAGGRIEDNELFGNAGPAEISVGMKETAPFIRWRQSWESPRLRFITQVARTAGKTWADETNGPNTFYAPTDYRPTQLEDVSALKGTAPVIRGNRIHDCAHVGILVGDGASGTIEDNDVYNTGMEGVVVTGAGTAPLVRSNRIRDGQSNGIVVRDGAGGQIIENTISGNRGEPISCEPGTSPDLVANTIQ